MKAFANNIEIDPLTIGPPAMNYGQHQRFPSKDRHVYRYEIDADEFRVKIADCFEEFRRGELGDTYDEQDAAKFPQLFAWRSQKYPDLDNLITRDPELLIELLKYWEYDISHALSEFADTKPTGWIVMSIDDVRMSSKLVIITGATYERKNAG